jgi:hypothetical protein
MKILIWIHKSEAISGKITKHTYTKPYCKKTGLFFDEWVQVEITTDEFAQLEDKSEPKVDVIPDIVQEHQTITGGEFQEWWSKLTKEEQITITTHYERN